MDTDSDNVDGGGADAGGVEDSIKRQIADNPILLYMKGSPDAPQCGFSAQAAQVLIACGTQFSYVDILSNPDVRATLPKIAGWPTFPQLWVAGELLGGSDIMQQMYESGELAPIVQAAAKSEAANADNPAA